MKEQILYLDPHDDFYSVRDKMGWAQTDRLLLVVPPQRNKKLLSQLLDVQLLQRHATQLGAKVALVTDDPQLADLADSLGISVFDSIDDSHLRPWHSRRALPLRVDSPQRPQRVELLSRAEETRTSPGRERALGWLSAPLFKRTLGISLFAAAMLALLAMLVLVMPAAVVTLTAQGQTIEAVIPITASLSQVVVDPLAGRIPATLAVVEVTGTAEAITTGTVDEATDRASGVATFTNLTAQAVRIPAGTAVRTTGGTPIRFVTQQDVTLDPTRGATGEAPLLAIEPGPPGNVEVGLINSIEGPLSAQAAVINLQPTRGGEVRQVASVTQDDRARLKAQMLADLQQQGYAEILQSLTPHQFSPPESAVVLSVLDETYSHFAGEKTDRLTLELRVRIQATVVDELQAFEVGKAEIDSRLGDSLAIVPGTLTYGRNPIWTVDESGQVTFDISARAHTSVVIDAEAVRAVARWQPTDSAADIIYNQFPLLSPPDLAIRPGWFPRMPWLAWRIDIVILPGGP